MGDNLNIASATSDFLHAVETQYDITSITAYGEQVWPFLRQAFFFQYWRQYLGRASGLDVRKQAKCRRLLHLPYGIRNWWRRYECIIFVPPGQRRWVDGKYALKDADGVMQECGRENSLTVEFPAPSCHYPFRSIPDRHVVSGDWLNLLAVLPTIKRGLDFENMHILQDICDRFRLESDYRWIILTFFRLVQALERLYSVWQPKVIFVSAYYGIVHQAAILAATRCGITSVELQHGMINDIHFAYNMDIKLSRAALPDYLFVFGHRVRQLFDDSNHFIQQERVLVIGNGYLEFIRNKYVGSPDMLECIASYEKSVAVALIPSLDDKMIDFVRKAALLNSRILYVLIPRRWDRDYSAMDFPPNVRLFRDLEFYGITKFTDFHATVCSTTALEAPALGTPNILMNIDGMAESYYSRLLRNRDVTRFVETPKQLSDTVSQWQRKSRNEVVALQTYFEENHRDAVRRAIITVMV